MRSPYSEALRSPGSPLPCLHVLPITPLSAFPIRPLGAHFRVLMPPILRLPEDKHILFWEAQKGLVSLLQDHYFVLQMVVHEVDL